jgi:hypothetical protein
VEEAAARSFARFTSHNFSSSCCGGSSAPAALAMRVPWLDGLWA